MVRQRTHRILSLFANIGVAEAMLKGRFKVVVANELVPRRANLYKKIYPETEMICGDITSSDTYNTIVQRSRNQNVNVIIATPPCQGMSTVGPQDEDDERNYLTIPVINIIKDIHPEYVVIENVPNYINTSITHNGCRQLLVDVVKNELGEQYHISVDIINTADFGVPQSRDRMIMLLSRNDTKIWSIPLRDNKTVTLMDAIGWIPPIDPMVKDISNDDFKELFPLYEERKKAALAISSWNIPPVHIYRQVNVMQYTPTGKTAFDNSDEHKPKKADGSFVKGYHNTYMRQRWDTPAYTITMDNRKISSQGNVHPGRYLGKNKKNEDIYSDPRVLTLFELMLVMSLPKDWPLPLDTNEAFVRRIIGEGIPPLFIHKLFNNIPS